MHHPPVLSSITFPHPLPIQQHLTPLPALLTPGTPPPPLPHSQAGASAAEIEARCAACVQGLAVTLIEHLSNAGSHESGSPPQVRGLVGGESWHARSWHALL